MANEQTTKGQRVKFSPPPPGLPILGDVSARDISYIGRTNYAAALEEKKFIFGIKRADRSQHMYLIGKSGMGKSKLIELLVRQDIAHGYGCCVVDPHGTIVDSVLDFIPKKRTKDVVLIDLHDKAPTVRINPFLTISDEYQHHVTQDLLTVFQECFGESWNTQIEYVLRLAILALFDYPDASFRSILDILTKDEFRVAVCEYIQDDMVHQFWDEEFATWHETYYTEALLPIVNMLSELLSVPLFKKMFADDGTDLDITSAVEEQKIILVNLARGEVGEKHARFFGLLFSSYLKRAGVERSADGVASSTLYTYIDECHRLFSPMLDDILLESEKYGLSITLSHQYIDQLTKKQYRGIIGSFGTLIIFRVGVEDAQRLKHELEEMFSEKDIANLGIRQFYIKTVIDGEAQDPFSAETLTIFPPPYQSNKQTILSYIHGHTT